MSFSFQHKSLFLLTLAAFWVGAPVLAMHEPAADKNEPSAPASSVTTIASASADAELRPTERSDFSLLAAMQVAGRLSSPHSEIPNDEDPDTEGPEGGMRPFFRHALGNYSSHEEDEAMLIYNDHTAVLNVTENGFCSPTLLEGLSPITRRVVLIGQPDENTPGFMDALTRLTEHCPEIKILELYGFDLKRLLDTCGDEISERFSQRFPRLETLMIIEHSHLPPHTLSRLPVSLRSIKFYQNDGRVMPVRTLYALQETDLFKKEFDWRNFSFIGEFTVREIIGSTLLIHSERLREALPHLQEINGTPLEALQPLDASTLLGDALPILEERFHTPLGTYSLSDLVRVLRIHMDGEHIEGIFGMPLEHFEEA